MGKTLILYVMTVVTIVMIFAPRTASAAASSKTTLLYSCTGSGPEPEEPEPERKRMPSNKYWCTVSDQGVYITGMDAQEICLYEIVSEAGDHIACFYDGMAFASYILCLDDSCQIRVWSQSGCLQGHFDRECD